MFDEDSLKKRQPGSGGGFYQVENPADNALMKDIILSTRRPKHIQEAVQEFISNVLESTKYIAIHWRYNKGDWSRHCEKLDKSDKTCKILNDNLFTDNPSTLVNNLKKFLLEQKSLLYAGQDLTLYLAAPHDTYETLLMLKNEIKTDPNLENVRLFTGADSIKFLELKTDGCSEFRDKYLYDSHSLFEQEICFHSSQFLWSTGSSWSMNVLQERALQGMGSLDAKNLKTIFGLKGS